MSQPWQLDKSDIESDTDSVSEISLSTNVIKCRQSLIKESFANIKSFSGIFFNLEENIFDFKSCDISKIKIRVYNYYMIILIIMGILSQ